jgi:hypothetical protein
MNSGDSPRAPIIVISFNRPQFLEPVLASLKAQRGEVMEGREVHLFQDGAVNRYSRIRHARESDIAASIGVFRKAFPHGTVHPSAENLGICENYRRAEAYVFEERGFEVAFFFEDDLIVSPVYIDMMDRLTAWAAAAPGVAYFAAYGDYYSPPAEVASRRRELKTLDHHWAFGLLARHWRAMQPLLEPFYEIVCGNDYVRRDHRRIFALYEVGTAAPRASSQDAAKAFACDRLRLWRANTVLPFARYIGNVGQHMTPEAFTEMGFERTVVAQEPLIDLQYPGGAAVKRHVAAQRELFMSIRRVELPSLLADLPARKYNPLRPCDARDVAFGYRLFLSREARAREADQVLKAGRSVFEFIGALAASKEYRKLAPAEGGSGLASRDDVTYAYRLCLHRDPDGEQIYQAHVGRTDPAVLTRAIWSAAEREKLWASVEPLSA